MPLHSQLQFQQALHEHWAKMLPQKSCFRKLRRLPLFWQNVQVGLCHTLHFPSQIWHWQRWRTSGQRQEKLLVKCAYKTAIVASENQVETEELNGISIPWWQRTLTHTPKREREKREQKWRYTHGHVWWWCKNRVTLFIGWSDVVSFRFPLREREKKKNL